MKNKRKLCISVLTLACSLFFSASATMASTYNDTTPTVVTMVYGESTYTVNGEQFTSDTVPYSNKDGRLMVSLSTLTDALGVSRGNISVENGIVSIINDDYKVVQFKVGKSVMVLNGAQIPLGCKAVEKNGRIYLPAKYVAMALGYNVDYNKDTKIITFYRNSIASSYTQVAAPTLVSGTTNSSSNSDVSVSLPQIVDQEGLSEQETAVDAAKEFETVKGDIVAE